MACESWLALIVYFGSATDILLYKRRRPRVAYCCTSRNQCTSLGERRWKDLWVGHQTPLGGPLGRGVDIDEVFRLD